MSLTERFQKSAEEVKELKKTPDNDDLLEIYGLYKQASFGDCNTAEPGMLSFTAKEKWRSWNKQKGITPDEAKDRYIKKVNELIALIGKK